MCKRLVVFVALTAVLGSSPAGGQVENKGQAQPDRSRAWATTTGAETKLTVEGIFAAGGPGTVAMVKPAAPQGINPKVLILDVKLGMLPGIWAAVLQPIPASYTVSPYKAGTYDSVHVRYPDGTSVMIREVIDAGAGPKGQ